MKTITYICCVLREIPDMEDDFTVGASDRMQHKPATLFDDMILRKITTKLKRWHMSPMSRKMFIVVRCVTRTTKGS